MVGAGYYLMLGYVFLLHSRLSEFLVPGWRIPLILAGLALLMAVVSGNIVRAFDSREGMSFVLLTGWLCLGVPFSVFSTGALLSIVNSWLKSWSAFIMVAALVTSRKKCVRLLETIAFASTVSALLALVAGGTKSGRLILEGSSLDDPNGLGMTLLFGLVPWMMVAADRSRRLLTRMLAGLCMLPILVAIPMTGSRGTLVGAMLVVAYLLKRFSIGGKAAVLLVVGLVAVASTLFVSGQMLDRFRTITMSGTGREDGAGSTESRLYLIEQGVRLILRYPVFGVGAGQFAVAENGLAQEAGMVHGSWHTAHNMFLQVGAETGLPGLIGYLMILWTAWKTLSNMEKLETDEHPRARQIGRLAFWVKAAFVAFCGCGLFLSTALSALFCIVTGLALALRKIVQSEMNQVQNEKEPLVEALQLRASPSPHLVAGRTR